MEELHLCEAQLELSQGEEGCHKIQDKVGPELLTNILAGTGYNEGHSMFPHIPQLAWAQEAQADVGFANFWWDLVLLHECWSGA